MFTLLMHYWRTDDLVEVFEKIAKDWMDVLEPFPQEAIEHACTIYAAHFTKKPVPADIRNRAAAWVQQRKPKMAALPAPPPPPRPRVDAEVAQRIMVERGFTPGRSDLLRRFPTAPTMPAAEKMAEARASAPHWSEVADPDGPAMQALKAVRDANPLVQAARAAQARNKEPKE